jgi:hypothetical protein
MRLKKENSTSRKNTFIIKKEESKNIVARRMSRVI